MVRTVSHSLGSWCHYILAYGWRSAGSWSSEREDGSRCAERSSNESREETPVVFQYLVLVFSEPNSHIFPWIPWDTHLQTYNKFPQVTSRSLAGKIFTGHQTPVSKWLNFISCNIITFEFSFHLMAEKQSSSAPGKLSHFSIFFGILGFTQFRVSSHISFSP